jgi:hypothetical protein
MGAKDLTTPGGLVEIGLDGTVVGEYAAAKADGPTRYMPSVKGVTDTGLLALSGNLIGLIRPDRVASEALSFYSIIAVQSHQSPHELRFPL